MHVKFLVFWGIYTFHLIKIQPSIRITSFLPYYLEKELIITLTSIIMIIVLSCFQLFHFGDAYPNYEELCRYDKCIKYVCEPWLRAIIGAVISWRIYNIQKKTSMKQDETLRHINELEESNTSNNIRKKFLIRYLA